MKRDKRRKDRTATSLRDRLDPRWASRLPDHYFRVMQLPGTPVRSVEFDLKDDGVISTLRAEFPEGTRPKTVYVCATREVVIFDVFGRRIAPLRSHIETARRRNSTSTKKKIVSLVPGIPDLLTTNPDYVFKSFDTVLALDTNTPRDTIGGDRVSVLGIAVARMSPLKVPELAHIVAEHAIEFRNLSEPKEKLGWAYGLDAIYRNGWLTAEHKVLVIGDAFLDEIIEMNEAGRIIEGITLPPNVRLAYASADTAQLFTVNKCLRAADTIADYVIEAVVKNPHLRELRARHPFQHFSAIRYWHTEEAADDLRLIGTAPGLEGGARDGQSTSAAQGV